MGWPRELPSLGYTAAFLGAGIGALYFGPLSERFGMGNVALIGALSVGSGTFLAGYVETPGQLKLIFGLLIGLLGNACMFAPLVAHVMRWFDRNRGLALGIATAGQSVGGAIWPFVITWLDGAVGWRDTFHIYGLLCFAIMVPLTLLLRRPAPPIASGSPAPCHARRPCLRTAGRGGDGGAVRRRSSAAASRCRSRWCISRPTAPTSASLPKRLPPRFRWRCSPASPRASWAACWRTASAG